MPKRRIKRLMVQTNKKARTTANSVSETEIASTRPPTGNELFARLPFEIRIVIWTMLLQSDDDYVSPRQVEERSNMFKIDGESICDYRWCDCCCEFDDKPSTIRVTRNLQQILLTCRLFYHDQQDRHTFYEANVFQFFHPTRCIEYLAAITPSRRASIRHIDIVDLCLFGPTTKDAFRRGLMGWKELFVVLADCVGLRTLTMQFDRPADGESLLYQLRRLTALLPLLEVLEISQDPFHLGFWRSESLKITIAGISYTPVEEDGPSINAGTTSLKTGLLSGSEAEVRHRFSEIWNQMRSHRELKGLKRDSMATKRRSIYQNIRVDVLGEDRAQPEPVSLGPSSHTRSHTHRRINKLGQFQQAIQLPQANEVQRHWQPFKEIRMSTQGALQILLMGRSLKTPTYPKQPCARRMINSQGSEETWKDLRLVLHYSTPEDVVLSFAYDVHDYYWSFILGPEARLKAIIDSTPHPIEFFKILEEYVAIAGEDNASVRGLLRKHRRVVTLWDNRIWNFAGCPAIYPDAFSSYAS